MKWIVFYTFVQLVFIPCPERVAVPDQFGRVYAPNNYTLQACYETYRTPLNRVFENRVKAEMFIKEASREPDLQDFRLEKIEEMK